MDVHDLSAAQSAFGADLLRELCAAAPGANVFISPVSLATALALAYNGAQAATAAAMSAAMHLPPGTEWASLNMALSQLAHQLSTLDRAAAEAARFGLLVKPEEYKIWLQIACSLWLAAGVPFDPAYLTRVRAAYDAALEPATDAVTINAWLAEKTRGKITSILDQVEPGVSYLINTVTFRGGWARPFEVSQTRDAPFHLLDGGTRRLPMMGQSNIFPYHEDNVAQSILLPLGDARPHKRAAAYFMIILPRPGGDFAALCAGADASWWRQRYEQALANSERYSGAIRLPRFRIVFGAELSQALGALGMGLAFSEQADFGALSPLPAKIKQVIHKSFLLVNEEGCEAAAASMVEMLTFGVPEYLPFEMLVDRPFLCAIVAARQPLPLFVGAVTEPEPA